MQDDDITIYVARDIWKGLVPDAQKLLFAIEGYGRFWLQLDDRRVTSRP